MPFAHRSDVRLYWRLDGAADAPALVLLHSIGTDLSLWEASMPTLTRHFRVLRFDLRGHGASDAPAGDYDLPMLAADVAAVMDAARVSHATVAGVSLGGMTAMQLTLDAPDRVDALALICTSARVDPAAWNQRIAVVRNGGTVAVADLAVERFLPAGFAVGHPNVADSVRRQVADMADAGYLGACAAIRDMVLADRLSAIAVPTLVVGGEQDTAMPFAEHGRLIADAIPAARTAMIDAGHVPPLDAPAPLAALLIEFLTEPDGTDAAADRLFEAGLVNRRRVLGDAWVDRSLDARTPFNADFQAMITRIAWHEVWGRPGLDDRTRRLLVVAITASLGRWEEFALHVRTGLTRGGFTRDELKEVLMQTAIYAGVPAANTAFAEAGRIIAEIDGDHA